MRFIHRTEQVVKGTLGAALIAVTLAGAPPAAQAAGKPNVLFVFSDDQRADTIAALGNKYIETPNLDRLVRQGTTCTRAYCMGAQQGRSACHRGPWSCPAGPCSASRPR